MIKVSSIKIPGDKRIKQNYLPKFRIRPYDTILNDDDLLEEEKYLYGHEIGDRFLPYLMQDIYTRNRDLTELKTIEMENDCLKAIFLPEFGMRLYSLFSKKDNRELLYVNPVMQIANLGIRNAWFSGGIEWNIGQLGHTFTTCDNLFASICKDENGKEFLRTYEWERCKGLYWYIDFHLEDGQDYLAAYVKMINNKDEDVSSYWWTNIAVPEEKNVRIFSGNKEVVYIKPSSNEKAGAQKAMGHGSIPYLPVLPGKDASYPENYTFASEYFFQNEQDVEQTWEAALYDDDNVFFDRSSDLLKYRKMFCWGVHPGGLRWQEFLTKSGTPKYVEIQGGLAPTQVHGIIMPKNTTWDFVQVFGGTKFSNAKEDWDETQKELYKKIEEKVTAEDINNLLEKYRKNADIEPTNLINEGNGFAAIEEVLCGNTPKGFYFPSSSIKETEKVWLDLIKDSKLDEIALEELPTSYITDLKYENALLKVKGSYTALNLLSVMYIENALDEKAKDVLTKAIAIKENPLSYRNLYCVTKDLKYFDKAIELLNGNVRREYAEEYLQAINNAKDFEKQWDFYLTLKDEVQHGERVQMIMLEAAIALKKIDFLDNIYSIGEFSIIREGERALTDYYFYYQALKYAEANGVEYNDALVKKFEEEDNIPRIIDFRLTPKQI